jgi:predicted nucleic acid-binding protein
LPAVFADTAHYLAVLLPRDRLHATAVRVSETLRGRHVVTTAAVLVEVLAYVAEGGPLSRSRAVRLIDYLRTDADTVILPQSRELFDAGLDLYRRRGDKGYSLTDCMSMVVCRDLGIEDVLTHDQHFAQERFRILL